MTWLLSNVLELPQHVIGNKPFGAVDVEGIEVVRPGSQTGFPGSGSIRRYERLPQQNASEAASSKGRIRAEPEDVDAPGSRSLDKLLAIVIHDFGGAFDRPRRCESRLPTRPELRCVSPNQSGVRHHPVVAEVLALR